jgi:hypothetical protein
MQSGTSAPMRVVAGHPGFAVDGVIVAKARDAWQADMKDSGER